MRLNFMNTMVRGDTSLTDIICLSCKHKNRMETEVAQRLMESLEILRQVCPGCNEPYSGQATEPPPKETAFDNEFVKYGKSIGEVLSHRGKAEDLDLDVNIGFILLEKYQCEGLSSFSTAERHIYAVQALSREVNNGGFEQFFYNSSGALAFDLVPALENMGSSENLALAKEALRRFGNPPSLSEDDRSAHISRITDNGDTKLWEDLDNSFYANPEDLERMILDYAEKYCDSHDS
jgi:hypothetical protein